VNKRRLQLYSSAFLEFAEQIITVPYNLKHLGIVSKRLNKSLKKLFHSIILEETVTDGVSLTGTLNPGAA